MCIINFLMISIIFLLETLKKINKYIACISILLFFTWDKFWQKYNRYDRSIITIPTMRSSALSLIDSSLSSKHCRTISLKTVKSVRSTQNGFTIIIIIITQRHWGSCNNHYWNRNQWIRMMYNGTERNTQVNEWVPE